MTAATVPRAQPMPAAGPSDARDRAGRWRTLAAWALLALALVRVGTLAGGASAAPAPAQAPAGAQWHDDAMGDRHALATVADRATFNRSGVQSTDDALPGRGWASTRPVAAPTRRALADALCHAGPACAAYRARAPPTPA